MLSIVEHRGLIPPDHPIRRIRVGGRRGPRRARRRRSTAMYATGGPPQRAARDVVEGNGADGDVLDPFGASVLRAAQLRPVVQVVPRHAHRRSRRSTRPRSRRTASGCWTTTSRTSSSRRWCVRRSCAATSRRDHFSVDGTLLKAWASHKSFKPKDGAAVDEPAGGAQRRGATGTGQKRSNDTHASTTDPEARLYRKSNNTAATLCYSGHLLMENRNALDRRRRAHRRRRLRRARHRRSRCSVGCPGPARRRTVAGGQGLRHRRVRRRGPRARVHAARRPEHQRATIRDRRAHHPTSPGHGSSQRIRKRIEEPFGWVKTIGGGRKLRYIGRERNRAWFKITAAIYNLIRITALDTQPA